MGVIDRLEAAAGDRETARTALRDTLFDALANSRDAASTAHAWSALTPHLDRLLTTPADVDRLHQTILQLAVKGRLVPQDPNDEPAAKLLEQIAEERERLIARKQIKRRKLPHPVKSLEEPFCSPNQWCWARLGAIGFAFEYGSSQKSSADKVGPPILRMNNISKGVIVFHNLKYLRDNKGELPALFLKDGDILFNRTNSYQLVGKAAQFRGRNDEFTFASYLIRVSLPEYQPLRDYIDLYLQTRTCRIEEIEPEITQQNGQANFNGTKLQLIRIPLPPLAEQARIVTKFEELAALCDRLCERLATRQDAAKNLAEALVTQASSAEAPFRPAHIAAPPREEPRQMDLLA